MLLKKYKNGNYTVSIYSDGTKIRETEDDEFIPDFAENMDITITKKCTGSNCRFCYLGCTSNGKHADIMGAKFIDTLHPGTELALNGNDMSHPDLIPFLIKLKSMGIYANMTVNQVHFEKFGGMIRALIKDKLIRGIGVSLVNPTKKFIEEIKQYPNAVIHTINGVHTEEDYLALADNDLKVLVLGYKEIGRGIGYMEEEKATIKRNQSWLYDNIFDLTSRFVVLSFDNLAIEQLDMVRFFTPEQWEEFYMGDDGTFTFAIDMVDGTFASSSLSQETYPILDSVDEMFKVIKDNKMKKLC